MPQRPIMILTKTVAKFIKSLQIKKHRAEERMFVAEGAKTVLEVVHSDYEIEMLLATEDFFADHKNISVSSSYTVSKKQLAALGTFKSNDSALAVVKMKTAEHNRAEHSGYTLALDTINDPGNLGTIIRLADWYGIKNIIAGNGTTDVYNPKTIAAGKGSFTRVNVRYRNLSQVLENNPLPVYAAMMSGTPIHRVKFAPAGILLLGNEAHGIDDRLEKHITHRITIPKYGAAESLNVAMAAGIICDNIMRTVHRSSP